MKVSWCSWLSRQSNTLKVSGSSPGDAIILFIFHIFLKKENSLKKMLILIF